MPNVILGEQGYTELPAERTYEPRKGVTTTRRFKGESGAIGGLEATMISLGYSTRRIEGPAHELIATIGADVGDTPPVPEPLVSSTWEIQGGPGEVDLIRAPAADTMDAGDRKILTDLARGRRDYENTTVGHLTDAIAKTMFRMMSDGATSYYVFYPSLRNILVAPSDYIFPSQTTGVRQVFSTANILANNSVPISIANNLPASSTVTRTFDVNLSFYYGWLYFYPQISITIGNKIQLTREWQWGLWSGDLYTYNA